MLTQKPVLTLPSEFPSNLPVPKFHIGDRVQWSPLLSQDFGTIMGLEYALAPHWHYWNWRYVVWLDLNFPSRSWTIKDVAWENDLGWYSFGDYP